MRRVGLLLLGVSAVVAAVAAVAAVAVAQGEAPQQGSAIGGDPGDVERLGWIAGCWEGALSNGALYEEVFLPPRGGQMIGMSRMTRDGRTLSFEFIRIAEEDGVAVYAAQPSGRPPTAFRATSITDSEAVFENPEHDFPQRIRYRLVPPDSLVAQIEGERGGETRLVAFPMRRARCPGS